MLVDKGNHKHFMAKEIHEQPEVVGHTLAHYIDMVDERVALPVELPFDWNKLKRLSISACGTAFYAGLVAKYWFERFARLPVEIDIASEFRYREAPLETGDLAIFISQSGETADTLATLRYAKEHKQHVLSVVNVPTSTIARESDVVMPTLAGPEIGVASTKAFTCQLAVLACLAIAAGRARGVLSAADEQRLVRALIEVPRLMAAALAARAADRGAGAATSPRRATCSISAAAPVSRSRSKARSSSRKSPTSTPKAMPPASSSTGRSRLIDETMPVIVIAPHDRVFEKTVSNMQEVAARGGRIILVTDPSGAKEAAIASVETHDLAGHGVDGDAAGLCDPGAADRLSHGRRASAPTSTSRATSRNRSRWNRLPPCPTPANNPGDTIDRRRAKGRGLADQRCRPAAQLFPDRPGGRGSAGRSPSG